MSESVFGASCPRCQFEVSQERLNASPVICDHCGWTSLKTEKAQEISTTKTFQKISAILGVVMVAGFIHVVNWDRHFFTIMPLKVAQISGNASRAQLMEIADICKERMKPACLEEAYVDMVSMNPNDTEALDKLAKVQLLTKQFEKSFQTYKMYFANGGRDAEPAFQYAKLLEKQGLVSEASQYYAYAIDQKPDTLQTAVSEAYVKLLMKESRYEEAKKHIDNLRDRGVPQYFLSNEYDKLSDLIKGRS